MEKALSDNLSEGGDSLTQTQGLGRTGGPCAAESELWN